MDTIGEIEAIDLITFILIFFVRKTVKKPGKRKNQRKKCKNLRSCFRCVFGLLSSGDPNTDETNIISNTPEEDSQEHEEGSNMFGIVSIKKTNYDIPALRRKARTDIVLVRAMVSIQTGAMELFIEYGFDGNELLSNGNALGMCLSVAIPAMLWIIYFFLTRFCSHWIFQSTKLWAIFLLLIKISNVAFDVNAGCLLLTITDTIRAAENKNYRLFVLSAYSALDCIFEIFEIVVLLYLICCVYMKDRYNLKGDYCNDITVTLIRSDDNNQNCTTYPSPGSYSEAPPPTTGYPPPPPPPPPTFYLPPPQPSYHLPPPPPVQYTTPYPVLTQSQYAMQPYVQQQHMTMQSLFGAAPSLPPQTAPVQTTLTGIGTQYTSGGNFQMQSSMTVVHL